MKYTILVKTLSGFEQLLEEDILRFGGEIISVHKRSILCSGSADLVVQLNVCSGVSLYVYILLHQFEASDKAGFISKSSEFSWENYVHPSKTFSVRSDVFESELFDNSLYASLLLKDAIADRQRQVCGERSNIDKETPDIEFYQYIFQSKVSVYINTSGAPLYIRGYKSLGAKAPLNEVLAHGILRLAGYDGQKNFVNPMCGTGTLIAEGILLQRGEFPNRYRTQFLFRGFEWDNFEEIYKKILTYNFNKSGNSSSDFIGIDTDNNALKSAENTINNIRKNERVRWVSADFFRWENVVENAFVIINAPYDQRLKINHKVFFAELGKRLKSSFPGGECWILSAGKEHTANLGLKSSRSIPLFNGKIPVLLQQFKIRN